MEASGVKNQAFNSDPAGGLLLTLRFPRCLEICEISEVDLQEKRHQKHIIVTFSKCLKIWWKLSQAVGLTVAVAVVADAYGASKEAGGPAEVARALVGDVVISTDQLLRRHRRWARCGAAHDTVSAVGLIGHTGVSSRAHDI